MMEALKAIGDLPHGGGFGVFVIAVFVVICIGGAINCIIQERRR